MAFLFTYGSLQNIKIQKELFGRKLEGKKDILKKYRLGTIKIPENHPQAKTYFIAIYTGDKYDQIAGSVYELQDFELALADEYEGSSYERKIITLASNTKANIYCEIQKNNID
ncbi:gamma-glutamyl AIG2-like cyclotransferase [Leeuwenhoekiella aestuarii]|uniref:Gamma-glutamyl AIG2-like cyclotransferase n=1 Tax=Leeuwenhoekiella aestuarii TaxID=2249426 RepID=A0A4Q0NT78_9FLAO|nr:gamma-glutamylcyclotransferase family protein [Leeuwenhoekiella aestuarii]RXG13367.1 gamma-glutamyl AIG2-like cyclotransferase [Leeuwenhoekiella aestuarii]RXG14902.1 gamma-glutamyl AIG2-like cyclotransferase [Leeuwenhoekiella aestuarii]